MKGLFIFMGIFCISLAWLGFLLTQSPGFQAGWYQFAEVPGQQAIVSQLLSDRYTVVGQGSLQALGDTGYYLHLVKKESLSGDPEWHYLVIERRDDDTQFEPEEQQALMHFAKEAFIKLIGLRDLAEIKQVSYTLEETVGKPIHRFKLGLVFNDQYVEPDLMILQTLDKERQWIVICGAPNYGQFTQEEVTSEWFKRHYEWKFTELEVEARRVLSHAQGKFK